MHHGASARIEDLLWKKRRWNSADAYAESKLYDVILAFAVARRWPDVLSNALEPGWVPTRMGGPSAPDDLDKAHRTQVWLATSDDPAATVSGKFFHYMRRRSANPQAEQADIQERFIARCEELTGITLPS
jgi:NAD(P)-dependent dehydrogenase (short-subunit alcohol dehydrogenase family)